MRNWYESEELTTEERQGNERRHSAFGKPRGLAESLCTNQN